MRNTFFIGTILAAGLSFPALSQVDVNSNISGNAGVSSDTTDSPQTNVDTNVNNIADDINAKDTSAANPASTLDSNSAAGSVPAPMGGIGEFDTGRTDSVSSSGSATTAAPTVIKPMIAPTAAAPKKNTPKTNTNVNAGAFAKAGANATSAASTPRNTQGATQGAAKSSAATSTSLMTTQNLPLGGKVYDKSGRPVGTISKVITDGSGNVNQVYVGSTNMPTRLLTSRNLSMKNGRIVTDMKSVTSLNTGMNTGTSANTARP